MSMVGLLTLITYKHGDVWNSSEYLLFYDKPFENDISQLLEGAVHPFAYCCKGGWKTNMIVQSWTLKYEYL